MSSLQVISPKKLLLLAAALVPAANAVAMPDAIAEIFKRDPPSKIRACAPDADKKWQPAMDFDKDGCYNTPAIDANGNLNGGLKCGGAKNGHCRDKSDLDNNNVYSRARCNNGWCAYLYGYYFEKDQSVDGSCGVGHKNDWEHIVVWVKDGESMPAYVAASQHKGWEVKAGKDVRFQDTHPKMVYHQDGGLTHDFRFANEADDKVENHNGAWFFGDLVSYLGFPSTEIRDKMLNNDWGAALPDLKDGVFSGKLNDAKGGHSDITLDVNTDNNNSLGQPSC
ncbi:uncharacterized protein JN550_012691 [Neoarthrinium moseri]|uniref:uncharacterized protein n=1 Tax=Neoarthrinium moseri TaxID=1658444 RepID=UPI001FDC6035|nr:uncharacterized protein JN550_012691 [Neoarthrinium moseri]KAI1858407.1 hypothetical protein JN550_012691 [Neoarthrinium moseri]